MLAIVGESQYQFALINQEEGRITVIVTEEAQRLPGWSLIRGFVAP